MALDLADYARLTGDARPSDLALWPRSGTNDAALRQAIAALRLQAGDTDGTAPGFVSASAIRARSLQILTAALPSPIGCRLWPSASGCLAWRRVLARRCWRGARSSACSRTWGSRADRSLTVVAGEGAAWTGVGAAAGVLLGLAVSVVLVHVVNPQSFHWTMDLRVPLARC